MRSSALSSLAACVQSAPRSSAHASSLHRDASRSACAPRGRKISFRTWQDVQRLRTRQPKADSGGQGGQEGAGLLLPTDGRSCCADGGWESVAGDDGSAGSRGQHRAEVRSGSPGEPGRTSAPSGVSSTASTAGKQQVRPPCPALGPLLVCCPQCTCTCSRVMAIVATQMRRDGRQRASGRPHDHTTA